MNMIDSVYHCHCYVDLQVAQKLHLEHVPSAFQIRFAGCKGVITRWPDMGAGDQLHIRRKSMKKFESSHNVLEVAEFSKPSNVFRNFCRNYTIVHDDTALSTVCFKFMCL